MNASLFFVPGAQGFQHRAIGAEECSTSGDFPREKIASVPHSTEPSRFFMRRVCAWCCKELEPKPCTEKDHGEITHSICPECFKAMEDAR